jgi:tetratricopeptide (TPR) repeat protein
MRQHLGWFVCLGFLAISVPPLAFSADEKRDVETVERGISTEEMAARLAMEAEEQETLEGFKPVTYENILDDPDNLDLNFRYARLQLLERDYLSAAGTLERILMINPNLAPVRLFYGISLYQLDNLTEAERELEKLEGIEMSAKLREDVDLYLDRIRLSRKATRFSLRQSLTYGFDDNRNASARSKESLSGGVITPLTGTDRRRRDTSLSSVSSLSVTHDPGFQAGHEFFGSFTYFLQEQTKVDTLDLQSFGGEIGGIYKNELANVIPTISVSHLFLSRETFLRSFGFGVSVEHEFNEAYSMVLSSRFDLQDYQNIADNTTSSEREGPQFELDLTGNFLVSSNKRLSAGIAYTNKHAERKDNAYQGLSFSVDHIWLLGQGQYLLNSATVDIDYYEGIDNAIVGHIRRDKSFRYRISYGIPLTFLKIGNILPKPLKDINITLTYEYYRSDSNITNFSYRNNKYQALMSKTFNF